MTIQAAQIGMLASFVTKRSRRNSSAPARQHDLVRAHRRRQLRIEINFQLHWADQLVTHLAILRLGRNSRIGIVASETDRVTVRNCLERALLQPESIADPFRWFRYELFAGISLGLISLMADGTALRQCGLLGLKQSINK